MNKYSERIIELMAKAMENDFKISSVQFGDVSEVIFDGWDNYLYVGHHLDAVVYSGEYSENKAPLWWLHCSILVSLTDEQIEAFKASFIQ